MELKEAGDLIPGQGGCWLVHDNQLRILGQRPGNGDQLFRGDRDVFNPFFQIQLFTNFRQCLLCNIPDILPVNDLAVSLDLLIERDILSHGQVGKEGEVLIDDLYPLPD